MKDINDVVKELKEILTTVDSDEIKERLGKVIKTLNNVQAEIYEDLNSFDSYSEGRNEIAEIIENLLEKVDSIQYGMDNNWRRY